MDPVKQVEEMNENLNKWARRGWILDHIFEVKGWYFVIFYIEKEVLEKLKKNQS